MYFENKVCEWIHEWICSSHEWILECWYKIEWWIGAKYDDFMNEFMVVEEQFVSESMDLNGVVKNE